MSEQENKRQRTYDLLNAETKPKFLQKTSFLRKRQSEELNKEQKESFLTVLAMAIKKDSKTSIGKHVNELEVYEKTVKTAIK